MRKWLAAASVLPLVLSVSAASVSASPTHTFTVVFKSATLPANAASIVQAAGGTVVGSVAEVGMIQVEGPASLMDTLNSIQEVAAVSPTLTFQLPSTHAVEVDADMAAVTPATADLYNAYQWDIKQMTNNGASWSLGTGSHNTVVGIIDTGVSRNHSALKANLLGGHNFVPDGPGGAVIDSDIEDKHGHGSHVAGNIAGKGRILGIAPDVAFRSYRVFGATGGSPSDRIINAIIAAANEHVDVISMSIGGYDSMSGATWTDENGVAHKLKSDVADFVAYRRAVQYATDRGILVVAAAGNEATNISNPSDVTAYLNAEYGSAGYDFRGASREVPGTLAGVVTVSATGPNSVLASYSNYGAGAIDVAAPGGDFARYPAADYYLDMSLSSYKNGGYVWMAGTSMATPKVSAVAALIIDQAKASGQKITPSQVVAKLQQTAVDAGKPGADPFFGKGIVNAYNALGGK